MFNEIEEAVVAVLGDRESGLSSDDAPSWYVPVANIAQQPPDLQRNPKSVLPAVSLSLSEFRIAGDAFAGIGELEQVETGLVGAHKLKFDLLYHLDIWATTQHQANAITQKAIEILLQVQDGINVHGDDYRLLSMRPAAGRSVPIELKQAVVFRRQLDYRIESELLIKTPRTPIKEVIVEQVEWAASEE